MARKSAAASRNEVKPEVLEKIRSDLAEWEPGKWAERVAYGPACTCGLDPAHLETNATVPTHGKPLFVCPRHDRRVDDGRSR